MGLSGVGGVLIDISAVLIAAGVIVIAARRIYRVVNHIDRIHEVVLRELVPNGGGALVDRVATIERRVEFLDDKRTDKVEADRIDADDNRHLKYTNEQRIARLERKII